MTTTETGTYQGMTAEEWRAKARGSEQRRAESWERSDTDGFMSQWASGLMAQEYEECADLAEKDGMTTTPALFFADTGEVASTHLNDGRWGQYWVLNDKATAFFGKRFLNRSNAESPAKRRDAMVKRGFTVGRVKVAGHVQMRGANVTSVRPVTLPVVEELKGGNYEVLTTDVGPEGREN